MSMNVFMKFMKEITTAEDDEESNSGHTVHIDEAALHNDKIEKIQEAEQALRECFYELYSEFF